MKKIILASAVTLAALASQLAVADDTTICNRSSTSVQGTAPAAGTAGTHFMVTVIQAKCSANVRLEGTDGANAAWYTVAGNSNKGKNTFGASTGGFTITTACAIAGGCTNDEVATAKTASNRGT